jgi:hypothetical protein
VSRLHSSLHGESELNRLLRRADWRFLLAEPYPARSRCFCDGDLRRAVELISGRVLDDANERDLDLVVLSNPHWRQLEQAYRQLRPGGSCYLELLPPARSARRRRWLEGVGFKDSACYWPWPPPQLGLPQFWLPLDAPGALAFFLETRPNPGRALVRACRRVRRRAWYAALRMALLSPLGVIAQKPGPANMAALTHALRRHWPGRQLPNGPRRLSCTLLTGGPTSINKVVGLVQAEGECRPRVAFKAGRTDRASAALAHESTSLQAAAAAHVQACGSVPHVLFDSQYGPLRVLGETALVGTPISSLLTRANYATIAQQASNWLTGLGQATRLPPDHARTNTVIEPALMRFRQHFGDIAGQALLQQCEAALAHLSPLPAVYEQRDFSPWNVHLDRQGKIIILDWESACPVGLPLLDLVYFSSYLAFFVDGAMTSGRFEASYRRLLDPATMPGQIFEKCTSNYVDVLGVPRQFVPTLRMFTWLLHTNSDYVRLSQAQGNEHSLAALPTSLFLRLLRQEVASW